MRVVRVLAAVVLIPLGAVAMNDVLHLKEGDPLRCEILEITDQIVKLKVSIKVPGGEAYSTKVIPTATVELIDFAPLPGETLLLESATVAELEELEALWDAKRANLKRPNSNAGEIGNLYAATLLDSGAAVRAREVYLKIEAEDWDVGRRGMARQGRLRTLIVTGDIDAAVKEATVIAEETEDAGILNEAKHVLATAEFGRLRELVEENPRWEEDDEVRPERNRLFHRIIDEFLSPYLFHGADEEASARGIWSAIEVYLHAGEREAAVERAKDLVALYPKNPNAEKARKLISEETAREGVLDESDQPEKKKTE